MIAVGRTVDVDDVLWNAVGAYAGYRLGQRRRGSPSSIGTTTAVDS
jgi:hypothetical protein